ncbi:MAG: 16S rRNA (guanine(966)-N(2))-methyltransferase RsmD [Lachnospiraceae bacterium]|nr:16S rRNA (guanine(966)-N(2))-methyltransferase RsmD [Lachnospiraceae bacterium]
MRVIAGSARRMNLVTPKGEDTRPTQDRIKETLFNMLQNEVPGCVFVDLFAGSGGIGIEALSRGARHAYFVENGKEAAACVAENLRHTHLEEKGTLLKQDVVLALRNIHEKEADIVYLDPPYEAGQYLRTLSQLAAMSWVTDDTLILVECPIHEELEGIGDLGLRIVREKNYKTNRHLFIKRKACDEDSSLSGQL